MATITGLTADRMLEIEGESIVDGSIDGSGHLILVKFDGSTIDAGPVVGPTGATGPQGPTGAAGVASIPGEIKAWSGLTLPAQGTYGKWVWADGGIYATATYPIASGHIHTNWKTAHGQSDPGVGNFRVPDLRGLTLAGLDQMPGSSRANRMTRSVAITIASKTGEETHIITVPEMPTHHHGDQDLINLGTSNYGHAWVGEGGGVGAVSNVGGGVAHENVQPTVFVPYIVRLDG